jgi:hypothetical protein
LPSDAFARFTSLAELATDSFLLLPAAQNFAFLRRFVQKAVFLRRRYFLFFHQHLWFNLQNQIQFRAPACRGGASLLPSPAARKSAARPGFSLRTHPRTRREWFSNLLLESTTLTRNTLLLFQARWLKFSVSTQRQILR